MQGNTVLGGSGQVGVPRGREVGGRREVEGGRGREWEEGGGEGRRAGSSEEGGSYGQGRYRGHCTIGGGEKSTI